MNKKIIVVGVLSALAICSMPVFAQDGGADQGRVFLRGELGKAKPSGGKSDTSFGLRGGYYFNRYVGLEGFYTRLYNQSETYRITDTSPVTGKASTNLSALGAGVVGKYNFGDSDTGFFVSGRAGMARMRGKVEWNDPAVGVIPASKGSESASSTNPYFGVGVGYDFTPNMGVSLNFDQYRGKFGKGPNTDKFKVNNTTLGFEYRF